MIVSLQEVTTEEREALWRLLQLAMHDYSEFDRFEIEADGTFPYRWFDAYFKEPSRHAWFFMVGDRIGGFVMVREGCGQEDWDYSVAEFFVLRRYRREGVGLDAAQKVIGLFPGVWGISFDDPNTPAVRFWRKVASSFKQVVLQREPGSQGRGRYLVTVSPDETE